MLSRQKSENPTILQVIQRKDLPPEVRVLKSSGNRALDLLACRQLAVFFGNNPTSETEKYYTVTWEAPAIKKDDGGFK
ncbi:hypothetical protein SDC9_208891 [bioreactor metagenome]|uniref:Uncharacterized protein n=1 Tax=bioreactor metagenome TaxID=1076179 RepID=A0A645JCU8_9ZZZZ